MIWLVSCKNHHQHLQLYTVNCISSLYLSHFGSRQHGSQGPPCQVPLLLSARHCPRGVREAGTPKACSDNPNSVCQDYLSSRRRHQIYSGSSEVLPGPGQVDSCCFSSCQEAGSQASNILLPKGRRRCRNGIEPQSANDDELSPLCRHCC